MCLPAYIEKLGATVANKHEKNKAEFPLLFESLPLYLTLANPIYLWQNTVDAADVIQLAKKVPINTLVPKYRSIKYAEHINPGRLAQKKKLFS